MSSDFSGRVALVTGAASGIGRATALLLAARGARVVLADMDTSRMDETRRLLPGPRAESAVSVEFDAGDSASCRHLVDTALAVTGTLDVLCNIAGIWEHDHSHHYPESAWDRMVRINLGSVFHVTQRALPHLLASHGCVVNMASAAGLMGVPYNAAYCATKAGVIGMTRAMAVEYASQGVRFNAVCPGGVKTAIAARLRAVEGLDESIYTHRLRPKLGQYCEPEEIALAVAYLASDDARNVTGTCFSIDGGQLAG